MLIAQRRVVLVLVQYRPQTVICSDELIQFGWTDSQNRDKVFDLDDFDIHDWLHVINLNKAIEGIYRLAVAFTRLRHIAPMENVAVSGTKQHLK